VSKRKRKKEREHSIVNELSNVAQKTFPRKSFPLITSHQIPLTVSEWLFSLALSHTTDFEITDPSV
jgi:hypothetical protein